MSLNTNWNRSASANYSVMPERAERRPAAYRRPAGADYMRKAVSIAKRAVPIMLTFMIFTGILVAIVALRVAIWLPRHVIE